MKKRSAMAQRSVQEVRIQQNDDVLRASLVEPEVFTEKEKAMFMECEPTQLVLNEVDQTPRVSVFQRLGKVLVHKPMEKPNCVSVFQCLGKAPRLKPMVKFNKNKKWKLNKKRQGNVVYKTEGDFEVAQVNCTSFEEDVVENSSKNEQVEILRQDDSLEFVDKAHLAPPQFEEGGQATVDELRELNLGTSEDPKPIFVSALLTLEELEDYEQLLREYRDVFAWGYQDMPGLDPNMAVHKLSVSKEKHPTKQAQRHYRPELVVQIKDEIDKLINVGFIREVYYPKWLANIVPIKKKNGQVRICVDFRDLNEACPKDKFPLPITELLIDATTGFGALSFMDGFSGYNQIKMAPEDEELTAFRTPKGIYYYPVMPFGLKNAGATYQRTMTNIFNDILHNTIECYVDDLVVKTKKGRIT